jgi:hypothetical protein
VPSIAVDDANRLHVSWWTGREGAAGVKYTFSDDKGQTFSAPVKLGVAEFSKAAHAQLVLVDAQRVAVTWDDGTTRPSRIALRVSNDRGVSFDSLRYLSMAGATAGFPVLAVTRGKLSVLWQEKGAVATRARAATTPATGAHWRPYDGSGSVRLVRYEAAIP